MRNLVLMLLSGCLAQSALAEYGWQRDGRGFIERDSVKYVDFGQCYFVDRLYINVGEDDLTVKTLKVLYSDNDTQTFSINSYMREGQNSHWQDIRYKSYCIRGIYIDAESDDRDRDSSVVTVVGELSSRNYGVRQGTPKNLAEVFFRDYDGWMRGYDRDGRGHGRRPGQGGGRPGHDGGWGRPDHGGGQRPPPVIVQPPPVIVQPPPVIQPPVGGGGGRPDHGGGRPGHGGGQRPPPVIVQPPPVVVTPPRPPVAPPVAPPPVVVTPPPVVTPQPPDSPRQRECVILDEDRNEVGRGIQYLDSDDEWGRCRRPPRDSDD